MRLVRHHARPQRQARLQGRNPSQGASSWRPPKVRSQKKLLPQGITCPDSTGRDPTITGVLRSHRRSSTFLRHLSLLRQAPHVGVASQERNARWSPTGGAKDASQRGDREHPGGEAWQDTFKDPRATPQEQVGVARAPYSGRSCAPGIGAQPARGCSAPECAGTASSRPPGHEAWH